MKILLTAIVFSFVSACDFSAEIGTESMQSFHGAGITFEVPLESNNVKHGDFGISYESESLKAETNGKSLLINGKSYGAVKEGDIVNLRKLNVVLVNGKQRSSDT